MPLFKGGVDEAIVIIVCSVVSGFCGIYLQIRKEGLSFIQLRNNRSYYSIKARFRGVIFSLCPLVSGKKDGLWATDRQTEGEGKTVLKLNFPCLQRGRMNAVKEAK